MSANFSPYGLSNTLHYSIKTLLCCYQVPPYGKNLTTIVNRLQTNPNPLMPKTEFVSQQHLTLAWFHLSPTHRHSVSRVRMTPRQQRNTSQQKGKTRHAARS